MIAYCPRSRFTAAAEESPLRCPITGEALEYREVPAFDPDLIDPSQPGHWRYAAMLPVIASTIEPSGGVEPLPAAAPPPLGQCDTTGQSAIKEPD